MAIWETDDEYLSGPAAVSLPTPQDTPYRTPSRTSRKSRRSITPPGQASSSPPPMPKDVSDKNGKRSSKDISMDESISILDPRRFTPTLHANLVSEILALRRDQEEKTKLIESLETTLHSTREEQEALQENAIQTAKESRSLKRQLALLEGGTSSALGELARERDEAVDTASDTKKRLDAIQKKLRTQEDDSQRVHDLWAQEKDAWEDEKRKYERRVHVAESRLKVVLDEVAAFQASQTHGSQHPIPHGHDSDVEESGKDNDGASVRSMSMTNSIRFSVMNSPGSKANGHSLADELNFEGDDDDQTDHDGRESALSTRGGPWHARNLSRDSVPSKMHRRNHSIESLKRPRSVARGKLFMNQSVLEALEGEDEDLPPSPPKPYYTDTGIQYSPPPSPKMSPVKPSSPETPERAQTQSPTPRGDAEIEANQRRKRVQISPPSKGGVSRAAMVSAASQTTEDPAIPPRTPKLQYRPLTPPPEKRIAAMSSSSTQTDDRPQSRDFIVPAPPPVPIPSINIQPPTSRPTTPREPRLPQYFKHFGCQVNLSKPVSTCDVGVQTQGIQVDKRMAMLPAHLQPSAITSRPSSPAAPQAPEVEKVPDPNLQPVPPRNPRRLASKGSPGDFPSSPVISSFAEGDELHDVYPGNNDDGPLSGQKQAPVKRPHRFSSLFAGFDTASSDEADEFADADVSDSEYRTALSAPRPQSFGSRSTKRNSSGTISTSPEQATKKAPARSSVKAISTELYSSFSLGEKESTAGKGLAKTTKAPDRSSGSMPGASNKISAMRKAAMIQNGIVSHQGRTRSPSLPETKNPPFPIPTRASSRRPPFSASAPSDGQRSPTRVDSWQRNSYRSSYRPPSIRKTRSAAALPRNHRYRRQGSRSPPPLSPSTEAPESPGLPPLPRNDITTPRTRERGNSRNKKHRHQLSTNTDNTFNTEPVSTASAPQSSNVVDAIAQAMVGEWMFKYVRRRTSFGVPEGNGKDESGSDRHKRWVWLAPYERAILWSSKQPSTGSALMGKTGRKLTIQSVLDVRDDNPAPKGAGPVFNRSILILTPQRALKFTAVSSERHYIWLTALSFLAHSSQAVPEIVNPQPQPPPVKPEMEPNFELPRPKGKRSGIRDSIRLAKGRTGASKAGTPSIPSVPSMRSVPSAPSSQMGEVTSYRVPESVGAISSSHTRETSRDAAEPPFIPRFHERPSQAPIHGRKRSNTGGRVPPPLSFRGFSGPGGPPSQHNPTNSVAGASVGTAGSSDIYQSQGSSATTWGMSQTGSQRTSEASSRPSNFFDAIGTVRMEAFISPLGIPQFEGYPNERDEMRHIVRRRSKEMRRRRSRSRHRDSYNSRGTRGTDDYYGGSRTAGEEDYFREDPFRGF